MQLPQHIIDLVGYLYDEGIDDENICLAVLKAWEKLKLESICETTRDVTTFLLVKY